MGRTGKRKEEKYWAGGPGGGMGGRGGRGEGENRREMGEQKSDKGKIV